MTDKETYEEFARLLEDVPKKGITSIKYKVGRYRAHLSGDPSSGYDFSLHRRGLIFGCAKYEHYETSRDYFLLTLEEIGMGLGPCAKFIKMEMIGERRTDLSSYDRDLEKSRKHQRWEDALEEEKKGIARGHKPYGCYEKEIGANE